MSLQLFFPVSLSPVLPGSRSPGLLFALCTLALLVLHPFAAAYGAAVCNGVALHVAPGQPDGSGLTPNDPSDLVDAVELVALGGVDCLVFAAGEYPWFSLSGPQFDGLLLLGVGTLTRFEGLLLHDARGLHIEQVAFAEALTLTGAATARLDQVRFSSGPAVSMSTDAELELFSVTAPPLAPTSGNGAFVNLQISNSIDVDDHHGGYHLTADQVGQDIDWQVHTISDGKETCRGTLAYGAVDSVQTLPGLCEATADPAAQTLQVQLMP